MHFAIQKLFSLGLMTCTNQEVIFIDIIAMGFGKSNSYFCYPCVMTVELFLGGGKGGGGGGRVRMADLYCDLMLVHICSKKMCL